MAETTRALVFLIAVAISGCDETPAQKPAQAPPVLPQASAPETAASIASARAPRSFGFDDPALPSGWTVSVGRWEVTDQRALRQKNESASSAFNVILADARAKDLELRVRMRAVSGKIDQGGGLIWRAIDGENYFIARYNPLEKNLRVYTVKNGKRTELASADVELPADAWHTLAVSMRGDHFEGSIDGKKYLDVRSSTFEGEGRIGLWTKADAVTDFDDLVLSVP